MTMLTRAQVARRLGKSIATVRRLEGVRLHPVLDDDGVHRFDDAEVERVANGGGGRALGGRGDSGAGRSRWMEAQLRTRSACGEGDDDDSDWDCFDAEEESDGGDARRSADREFQNELARRERDLVERERAVAEREQRALARDTTVSAKREQSAAEALRSDAAFRLSICGQIARLIDDLDRLPPRLARKVLNDDDLALLEAVIEEIED